MDAAEADLDARLYKASGDLIPELQVKLPLLIWHDGSTRQRLRTHVPYTKSAELARILDRFQEWPQLLDPVLTSLVGAIVNGFTSFITTCPDAYNYQPVKSARGIDAIPLPAALNSLVYAFCKVRGYKVIVRLLKNEPRYVEPMLSCIRLWDSPRAGAVHAGIVWQTKYVMLLWLSHLMLAPFELSTLSTSNEFEIDPRLQNILDGLPDVAKDVVSVGFGSLSSPSKERESAVILLVRLSLRRDMQVLNLPSKLVDYSTNALLMKVPKAHGVYHSLGHLALLYSILNLGTDSEVAPYLLPVFRATSQLATSDESHHLAVRDSAPARKLLVKILRVCLVHSIALSSTMAGLERDAVDTMLEQVIQYFLDCLGDKDSPVRMAASKALSIVTLKLDPSMAAEIVEAVLGGLSENVLLEEPNTSRLMAKTELPADQTLHMKRNLSAVDPLRWHGLMLTLGHLLFRRSPPPHQLPEIIEALLLGIEFEQRSNVGTSIGVGVRDGACFGLWALARKYSTRELESISSADVAALGSQPMSMGKSVLQLIATNLVLSACLDPSGNIRRGSSAALQELIGRHPDTISQGISVVQVVDYQAVARRSRAMMEVAVQAASIDFVYHEALLESLIGWRGAKAADVESRRWASGALRLLMVPTSLPRKISILGRIQVEVSTLSQRNLGTTAGSRHGLLLCTAALIDSVLSSSPLHSEKILSKLESLALEKVTGNLGARVNSDLEFSMEGVGTFIESLAQLKSVVGTSFEMELVNFADQMTPIVDRCIILCERTMSVEANSRAMVAVFRLYDNASKLRLLTSWLDTKTQKHSDMCCRGRLVTMASLHSHLGFSSEAQGKIVQFLKDLIQGGGSIEARTNAMESLCALVQRSPILNTEFAEALCESLIAGLTDYTNDQRGDIGSILRLQSLEVVEALYNMTEILGVLAEKALRKLTPYVVKLAAERLNKVRYRAWLSLKLIWRPLEHGIVLLDSVAHPEDVSTESYYLHLMDLAVIDELREPLILGLGSSLGGTEDISRACCSAFASWNLKKQGEDRNSVPREVILTLLGYLNRTAPGEDHEVLPATDYLTFILDQDFGGQECLQDDHKNAWEIARKIHTPTSSTDRVEALLRLCNTLGAYDAFRRKALDKLTRQLLYRYPKIRNGAADILYASTLEEDLLRADWNAPSATNKPVVLELRKALGVAKSATS